MIGRCLASCHDLIDYWVICDTGSTDGTQELIGRALDGIPGELHETAWIHFGHNRTELMRLARQKAEYLLLIDADMTIVRAGSLPLLSADSYMLRQGDQTLHTATNGSYAGISAGATSVPRMSSSSASTRSERARTSTHWSSSTMETAAAESTSSSATAACWKRSCARIQATGERRSIWHRRIATSPACTTTGGRWRKRWSGTSAAPRWVAGSRSSTVRGIRSVS